MANAAARRRRTQVKSEARLRFGPQKAALSSALDDAVSTYVTNVAAAHTSSEGIRIAAKQAATAIPKIYADAGHSIDGVSGVLAQALGPAGAGGTVADLMRGAAATDAAGTKQRLTESMASALADTKQRGVDAAAGEAYSVQNAGAVLETTRQKLNQQLVELGGQRGAFTQGRLAELTDADVKARQAHAEKVADRSTKLAAAGTNPDGTYVKGGPKDPAVVRAGKKGKGGGGSTALGGAKPASRADVRTFRTSFSVARGQIASLRSGGHMEGKAGRRKMWQLLQVGVDRKPTVNAKKYAEELAKGTDKSLAKIRATVPGVKIPPITDPLVLSAALDMEYDTHISRANAKALHRAGIRLSEIPGAVSYSDYVRNPGRGLPSVPQASGSPTGRGQRRPT
jgi:hypothetical protein